MNTSISYTYNESEVHTRLGMKNIAAPFTGYQLRIMTDEASADNPDALCHVVPQPYLESGGLWMNYQGHLCDEIYSMAQRFIEHDFYTIWYAVDLRRYSLDVMYKKVQTNRIERPEAFDPVSLDFEIMQILPICVYLFVVALCILLFECVKDLPAKANEYMYHVIKVCGQNK